MLNDKINDSTYILKGVNNLVTSRHTVVCRAAQEAGAPHREYIYIQEERKRNFICYRSAGQSGESTYQI